MEIAVDGAGNLAAVHNSWSLDELFSTAAFFDYDRNANGRLDPDELEAVGKSVLDSISEFNFHTLVTSDGRRIPMGAPSSISAVHDGRRLSLDFEVKPQETVPIRGGSASFSNFDDTYFVAFEFEGEKGFKLTGMPPECRMGLIQANPDADAADWMNSIAKLGPDQAVPDDGIEYALGLSTRAGVKCS